MLESTKMIRTEAEEIYNHMNRIYKRAVKENDIQIWNEAYKDCQKRIDKLKKMAETKSAKHSIEWNMSMFIDWNHDIQCHFQNENIKKESQG